MCSAVDTAPTMEEDDGFTMVDETFGVREPSECSDQEEEKEENPPRFQNKTLVPAEPVQLGGESSSAAPVACSPQIPLATGSDDDNRVMLTALSGMESADTQGCASKTATRGVLAMLRRGINPESAEAGQVIMTSDKPSTLRDTAAASSASTPGRKIPGATAPATPAVVVEDPPSEIGPAGPPAGPSASTKKDSKEINTIIIIPAARNTNNEASTAPAAATPPTVAFPSRWSEPTTTAAATTPSSSGAAAPNARALIRKTAVFVAHAADPAKKGEEEPATTTKALTVRLVPGDCAFRTVVPRTGAGSLNTAGHVKREIERKLGLRQLVHLSFVVVSNSSEQRFVFCRLSSMLFFSALFLTARTGCCFIFSFPLRM